MTANTQALLAILLYSAFFAWIGWRRGFTSEMIVFLVAVLGWIVLQERGSIVVRLTNMVAGLAGIFAAEIAGGEQAAAPEAGGELIVAGQESGFLFLVWIALVFITYILTSRPFIARNSRRGGLAALMGIINGLFFLTVLLPKFNALYDLGVGEVTDAPLRGFVTLLAATLNFLVDAFLSFWNWLAPPNALALLIVLTVLLALTAMTLRRGARAR